MVTCKYCKNYSFIKGQGHCNYFDHETHSQGGCIWGKYSSYAKSLGFSDKQKGVSVK